MGIKISAYNYASEIEGKIQNLLKYFAGLEENIRFIVPSRKDKSWFPVHDAKLWTWDEIYDDICETTGSKRKGVLSPPDHFMILDSIVQNILDSNKDDESYKKKIKRLPGIERPGFSSVVSGDIRELMNESVPPSQLIYNPKSFYPSEFLLPRIYQEYAKYLDDYDLLDSAGICTETYNEINKNQAWGKGLIIIFVGFMSFNHSQLDLVQALVDRCRDVVVLKPEANLKNFHDATEQFKQKPQLQLTIMDPPQKPSGNIVELPVTVPDLEAEVIARTLAIWSHNQWEYDKNFPGFDSIGISIDEGKERNYAQAFERYGVPYNFTRGVAINTTLPGKILNALKNLTTRNFPTYETAMLLAQPCFAGIKFPVMRAYRAGYSGLKHWEEYLQARVDDPEEALHEVFQDALTSIQAIRKFCGTLSRKNNSGEIMKAFYEFLTTKNLWLNRTEAIANHPEFDENTRLTASAIQTIREKYLSINELITDIGPMKDEKLKDDKAYEFLELWCKKTNTRAPLQVSNAVRIFVGNPPVLSHFPVWIMTGVNQRKWSMNIPSSPVLGERERKKFSSLPDLQAKSEQREALFRRLLQTGEKLVIILRPTLDSEGRPIPESIFMPRFMRDMPDWKANYRKAQLENINYFLDYDKFKFPEIDAGRKIFRTPPEIHMKANAVGASDIHELLQCSFLWWQKRQAEIYEPSFEVVPHTEWGNMTHKFWECVWKNYRLNMNAPGKTFLNIVDKEWQRLLQAEDEDYKPFARLVKDFRMKRKLTGIDFRVHRLSLLQAEILDNLHDNGYEHKQILLEEEAHLKAKFEGVTFLGQCDRIEILRTPSCEDIAFIADYKEGKSENSEKHINIGKYPWNFEAREKFQHGLQLSLYAALFELNHNCKLSGVYILGLEDGTISGTFSLNEGSYFTKYLPENSNGNKKKIDNNIAGRIDEGNYAMACAVKILEAERFKPEYQSKLCKFCHIKSLCRKGEFRGEVLSSGDDGDDDE